MPKFSPPSNFIIHIFPITITSELLRVNQLSKKEYPLYYCPWKSPLFFFIIFSHVQFWLFYIVSAIFKINIKKGKMLLLSTTITSELFRVACLSKKKLAVIELLSLKITFLIISYAFSFVFACIESEILKINVKKDEVLVLL